MKSMKEYSKSKGQRAFNEALLKAEIIQQLEIKTDIDPILNFSVISCSPGKVEKSAAKNEFFTQCFCMYSHSQNSMRHGQGAL